MQRVLITGGNGNLGRLVASRLIDKGIEVIRFDIEGSSTAGAGADAIIFGDVRDTDLLESIFESQKPDAVCHLASLLSGSSEIDLAAGWAINATSSFDLMRLGIKHGIGPFFFASSTATYGPVDNNPMPEDEPQWPESLYGATKVAVERLGHYFKVRHGLDFRCLRFPLVISPYAPPSAVSAYPSHALVAAHEGRDFVFPVAADTGISTLYLDDVVDSIVSIMSVDAERIKRPAYNLHAYHLSAQMVADEAQRRYPDFQHSFEPKAEVERLMRAWPDVIDDSEARADWGWRPACDFNESVDRLIRLVESSES